MYYAANLKATAIHPHGTKCRGGVSQSPLLGVSYRTESEAAPICGKGRGAAFGF